MDYQAFRSFRDEVLRTRDVLRLECMNPAQALARWRHAPIEPAAEPDPQRALAAWARAAELVIDPRRLVHGAGVRDLLTAVLACNPGRSLWLPIDVYPVYWQIAAAAGFAAHGFATLPDLDLALTDDPRSILVLPIPLTPAGRLLRSAERDHLQRWLAAAPERLLVVDAAYAYDHAALAPVLAELLASEQCVVLASCTKPWLCPDALGVAAAPLALAPALRARAGTLSPNLGRAVAVLECRPELPHLQQAAFRREWARIAPRLRAAVSDWQPPETGYFAVVACDPATLLDRHAILAVPASVFGSPRRDLAVVTCLHDLVANDVDDAWTAACGASK